MAFGDYRHRVELRVRWAEVDAQAVVFNGHYLTYCDVCVTEYWRAIGLRYPQDLVGQGSDIYVRKATLEYHAAARYDDLLLVCGRIARLGASSAQFRIGMYRKGDAGAPLVEAELVYVHADPVAHRSLPWGEAFRGLVRNFEATRPQEAAAVD